MSIEIPVEVKEAALRAPVPGCDTAMALSSWAMAQGLQLQKPLGQHSMAKPPDLHLEKGYNTTYGIVLGFHLHSSLFATNCRIIPGIHLKFVV